MSQFASLFITIAFVATLCAGFRIRDFTNIGIQQGPGNTSLPVVTGTEACATERSSAKFQVFRYGGCDSRYVGQPCTYTAGNVSFPANLVFTTTKALTLDIGYVNFYINLGILGSYDYPYKHEMPTNGTLLVDTQYTLTCDFVPDFQPPVTVDVDFEYNIYDKDDNLVICINGTVVVEGYAQAYGVTK